MEFFQEEFTVETINFVPIVKLDRRSHKWLQRLIFHFYTFALAHNLQKFGEVITFQTCNNVDVDPKITQLITESAITCNHIWHVDILKWVSKSHMNSLRLCMKICI